MENLGDILKRLATTRGISNGDASPPPEGNAPGPAETCSICNGRGWFTPDVPAGHPDFGRMTVCECQRQRLVDERTARLLRYSNLGHLTRFNFDTLDPRGRAPDPESQRLFAEAYRIAADYSEEPKGWLVFTGPNGSGKTHLAAAIANRAIQRGHVVFFVHVPDLLDHLRATFAPGSEVTYSELFDQVCNTPLLVLDGLGSQTSTPWALEKLQQIFNHRFNAQLPTIVTTASPVEELDPYIRSRLTDRDLGRVVQVRSHQSATVHRLGRIDPEMLRRMTFDTFDPRGNPPPVDGQLASLQEALRFARRYAEDPHGWLTLTGDTGVGKTHLSVAIAAERLKKGQPVFYAFVPELLDYLRYTFTPDSRITYDQAFDEIKNAPLLILDDLGEEHTSPWAYEKLYQVIVYRHNARLPTVITSRKDFIESTGPISSRVQDPSMGEVIPIEARDYRKKGRPAGPSKSSRKGPAR